MPVKVHAADLDSEIVQEIGLGIDSDNHITPYVVADCPGSSSGKHKMTGRGSGYAYYGSAGSKDLRVSGPVSQCKYCHLVLIAEGNPFFLQQPIGEIMDSGIPVTL